MVHVISQDTVTLLDINNYRTGMIFTRMTIEGKYDYTQKDTFMGFHCGNTCSKQADSLHNEVSEDYGHVTLPEEVTQGTLEGDIVPGDITFYRLQSYCRLQASRLHGTG